MGYPVAARNSFLDSHITGALTLAAYSVLPNDEGVGGTEVTGGEASGSILATTNTAEVRAGNWIIQGIATIGADELPECASKFKVLARGKVCST